MVYVGFMCLAQGHNAVTSVRLGPTALRSRVKNSTTEPLRSLNLRYNKVCYEGAVLFVDFTK